TGGAGFIGSHLVEHLLARGDDVVVVDNLSTGHAGNLRHLHGAPLTVIESTVGDALPSFGVDEFDEIYHLAAAVGVRLVIEQPIHTIETNVHETSAILRYATAGRIRTLIASSSEVYGKGTRTPFREDDDVLYGPTIYSRWSYACSKAIDEYLALAYARQHGLPAVVARFFNTVGPRQIGTYGMVLPRFVDAALAGDPLTVHGDGRQSRCFCDVRDVVRVLPELLGDDRAVGNVFNVGNDESIEIIDLAKRVISVLDSTSDIHFVPYDDAFGADFDDLRVRQPDLTKLRSITGFRIRHGLDDTIRDLARERTTSSPDGATT
ncbi:MAG: NAD-dependent epimerase/dehydratase family protein, partial [Phycisphaerales bacterium]|nr:NAD-dependent epimerase/dehydratase family protein [Phycisphaerales bacterium]